MKTNTFANRSSVRSFITLLALSLSGSGALAQWTGAGAESTHNYFNNPDNWSDPSQVGIIDATWGGMVNWTTNNGFELNGGGVNNTVTTLPGDFVFLSNRDTNITFWPGSGKSATWKFALDNSTIRVNWTTAAAHTLNLGDNNTLTLDLEGKNLTFDIQPAAPQFGATRHILNFTGALSNGGDLYKTGGGGLTLDGYNRTISAQSLTVSGGYVTANANTYDIGVIKVVNQGSVFQINATAAANLLSGTTALNLYSGAFSSAGATSQTVGAVSLYGGHALIASGNNSTQTLTLTTLQRENFATLTVYGNSAQGGVGNGSFIKVTNDTGLTGSALIGGGGAAGSTTISILPWVAGQAYGNNAVDLNNNAWWGAADLVTYTTAGGFRTLQAGEYYALNNSAAYATLLSDNRTQENVLWSNNVALNFSLTVNAVKIANNHNASTAIDQTLTVTSGAIIGDNFIIGGYGTIDSGGQPLIFMGRGSATVSAAITNNLAAAADTPGLIVANVGYGLTLSGNNTYGGMTLVQGNARFDSAGALPHTTELRIDRGGSAFINAASGARKLSGAGTLTVGTGGLWLGQLDERNGVLSVNAGGVLAPGDLSGDYQAGTLLVDATAVEFNAGSVFSVDLAADAHDLLHSLAANSTLVINGGAIALNFLGDYTPVVGDSWLLTDGFASTVGLATDFTVSDLAHPDWEYTPSFSNHNLMLTLTAIPEPATWALWLGGAALLLTLRRRR